MSNSTPDGTVSLRGAGPVYTAVELLIAARHHKKRTQLFISLACVCTDLVGNPGRLCWQGNLLPNIVSKFARAALSMLWMSLGSSAGMQSCSNVLPTRELVGIETFSAHDSTYAQ